MYTDLMEKLIQGLTKLPGIGRRSSERIVTYLLNAPKEEVVILAQLLNRVKEQVRFCSICHNLCETQTCLICQDLMRNKEIVCIVERPSDVVAVEKTGTYRGLYHVLLGAIAPLEGRGPADLKIDTLLERMKNDTIREVIIATDADTEGETTALYLTKVLKSFNIKLTRIGVGIPMGGNLEYADASTLSRALDARRQL